jgi:hypothetical protein
VYYSAFFTNSRVFGEVDKDVDSSRILTKLFPFNRF